MTWTRDPLADRRAERERLLELARGHAERLARRLPLTAALVAGSVARGDFNVWSDVDLVVIAEQLPAGAAERFERLAGDRPPRVEVHGYTVDEFVRALGRGDALAGEAAARGVLLGGTLPPASLT